MYTNFMNPFNYQSNNSLDSQGGPGPQGSQEKHGHKKVLLRHLINSAMGATAGKGLAEIITGIKNAIGVYKNYAKEWDNLNGLGQGQPDKGGGQRPNPQPQPSMPSMSMPGQNLQMPSQPPIQSPPNPNMFG